MTPGQFIDLLAEAGMLREGSPGVFEWKPTIEKAEKFAKIVEASERERICQLLGVLPITNDDLKLIRDVIRGEGEK